MAAWSLTLPLFAIIGLTTGVKVWPIQLASNNTYISYQGQDTDNSLLECPYTLEQNETLQSISWTLWNGDKASGTYEWSPGMPGVANGSLSGVVNLSREDGNLELTDLRYDLGGFYSCSVNTTTGETADSETWEILIIDTTPNNISTAQNSTVAGCTFSVSASVSAVFPEPSVEAGLYSTTLEDYYQKVPDSHWKRTVNKNKSVSYSFSSFTFVITKDTPYDVQYLLTVGVSKSDGSYIPLTTVNNTATSWSVRGCPPATHLPNQMETYQKGMKTCHNEYIPISDAPQVSVACAAGYRSDINVTSLLFTCSNETLSWETQDGMNMTDVDLECVTNGGGGGAGAMYVIGSSALVMGASLLLRLLLELQE